MFGITKYFLKPRFENNIACE